MHLSPLWDTEGNTKPKWRLYSILDETGACPVTSKLEQLLSTRRHEAHAAALVQLIENLSHHDEGPKLFQGNSAICHEAVSGEGIYSFRKGSLRLYWFYGDGQKVVVCSEVAIKTTDKTDSKVRKRLIADRDNYFAATKSGMLQHIA
jgi:hypothetical protein